MRAVFGVKSCNWGGCEGVLVNYASEPPLPILLWAETVFGGAGTVVTGVEMDQIDKMDPRRAKSAPGAIELNRHFGAETDLLNLQCGLVWW